MAMTKTMTARREDDEDGEDDEYGQDSGRFSLCFLHPVESQQHEARKVDSSTRLQGQGPSIRLSFWLRLAARGFPS